MIEASRDVFGDTPTEEDLKAELAARNQELAAINSRVGEILAAQRTAEYRVREVGKALQRLHAARVRRELATVAGTGTRA